MEDVRLCRAVTLASSYLSRERALGQMTPLFYLHFFLRYFEACWVKETQALQKYLAISGPLLALLDAQVTFNPTADVWFSDG